MDIIKSLTYIYKDKNKYYNLIIGSLIAFPLCMAEAIMNMYSPRPFSAPYGFICMVYGICSIIVGIFLTGYLCANSHYRLKNENAAPLSWANLDVILISGLKSLLANIIYKIPLLLILFIGFAVSIIKMLDLVQNPGAEYTACLKIVSAISYLIEIFIIPSFIIDLKLDSFFNFKRIGKLIRNNTTGFILLLITTLIISTIYTIFKTALHIPVVLWIPIDSFLTFYMVTIKSDLITQFVKENN